MAGIDLDQLRDPEQILAATSLRVAQKVEECLSNDGVDYAIQVESVGRSLLFRSERMGAVFYVNGGQAAYCRERLTAAGFGRDVVGN